MTLVISSFKAGFLQGQLQPHHGGRSKPQRSVWHGQGDEQERHQPHQPAVLPQLVLQSRTCYTDIHFIWYSFTNVNFCRRRSLLSNYADNYLPFHETFWYFSFFLNKESLDLCEGGIFLFTQRWWKSHFQFTKINKYASKTYLLVVSLFKKVIFLW